jgi:hypothetical protein
MALGLLILSDGNKRRYKSIDADKARRYWDILHGQVEEPTVDEADALTYIVDIKLPPSHRPENYKALESPYNGDRSKTMDVRALADPKAPGPQLLHEGIEQGMASAIPNGDR